ncbi:MAG: uncharacterized protein QOK49_2801 [Baekduia sp.]|nr:uncharacterized protein [Baekduia sp.]
MDPTKPFAVVTGASSGIGRELAKQFATNGYDLLIAAEDGELEAAAEELRGLGAVGAAGRGPQRPLHRAPRQARHRRHGGPRLGARPLPAAVAHDGFEALMAGEERVVSASAKTKAQGRASRFLPGSAKAEMHRRMAEPGTAEPKQ